MSQSKCKVCGWSSSVRCMHLADSSQSRVCKECRATERRIIKSLAGSKPYRRRNDWLINSRPIIVPSDYVSRYELELPSVFVSEWEVVIPLPEI